MSTAFTTNTPFRSIAISDSLQNSHFISTSIVFRNILSENTTLNQSTRNMIFNIVEANPGIHFRGICNILGISIGVAQYHLGLLTKAGLVGSFRDGRYKRFFNLNGFSIWEMKIISLLRRKTPNKILSSLLRKHSVSHKDLSSELEISSQALSWHIKRLKKLELLDCATDGVKNEYLLKPEKIEVIEKCLQLLC